MIRTSLFLLAGTLALQLSSFPPGYDLIVALIVALIVVLPWLRRHDLVVALIGGVWFWSQATAVVDARLEPSYSGDSMLVELVVGDFPVRRAQTSSFLAVVAGDKRVPERLQLSWFEPPVALRIGDVWRLELRLRRPRGNSNPGARDIEAWLLQKRIGASGYVVSGKHNRLLDSRTVTGVDRVRVNLVDRIERVVAADGDAAVLAAITAGARHLVSPEQWNRYARTGTSHLMAISGLHVGLAAAAAYAVFSVVLGLVMRRGNPQHAALSLALLSALGYAAASGFAVPAQRAALMMLLAAVAILSNRQLSPARVLAAAMLVIVAVDPLATMTAGFKLSFAAVALLLWLAHQRRAQPCHLLMRPVAALRGLALLQFVLLAGLLPLSVLIFSRISLAAPLVNLLAVPLFSVFTVPLALTSLVCVGPLSGLGELLLTAAASSVGLIEQLIVAAAELEHSAFVVAAPSGVGRLLLLLPLVWALLPPGWPGRFAAWLAIAALISWRPAGPPAGCVEVHTLDVGQGLATFIQTPTRALLYDTGPAYRSGGDAAERIVIPFLQHRGIHKLDRLIVSHSDLDHAGGVRTLSRNIEVVDLMTAEKQLPVDIPMVECVAGHRWTWDQLRFSILHPHPGFDGEGNDASCVLLIEAGDYGFLLTGDIESRVEGELVRSRRLPDVDAVAVPHHGSRTSSTAPFVQSLAPDIAVVSAGAGNRWGFPKPDVVARWQDSGATVLNTAASGAISVRLCTRGGIVAVSEHRRAIRRIWHDGN